MPKWIRNVNTGQIFEIGDNIPIPEGFVLIEHGMRVEKIDAKATATTATNILESEIAPTSDMPVPAKAGTKSKKK